MLTDPFADNWFGVLCDRAMAMPPSTQTYLLLDGVFVPGLHRKLPKERKAILFATLAGCTEEAEDASPFLVAVVPGDKSLKSLLRRCDRWPMVSAIDTRESLEQLAARLSAWCVVEAEDQRFNFRFPDTRRLPAIFNTLTPEQRAQIAGTATRWSYLSREGRWCDLEIVQSNVDSTPFPVLDAHQFAALVDDSQADEVQVLLCDRGHDVFRCPSRSFALLSGAIRAARLVGLANDELLDWCEWFWKQDRLCDDAATAAMLATWRTTSSGEQSCLP